MRLGVLDIGSNTGHLLVVDARGGAAPLPAYSPGQLDRLGPPGDGAVTTSFECSPRSASNGDPE